MTNKFKFFISLCTNANLLQERYLEILAEYNFLKNKLERYKDLFSFLVLGLMGFAFLMLCIGEFYLSRDLYREYLPEMPWIGAIVFIFMAMFISDRLKYQFIKGLKPIHLKEMEEREPAEARYKLESQLDARIKRSTMIGLVLAVFAIGAMLFLSYRRYQFESLLNESTIGYTIDDMLPVILYVFEIVIGVFAVMLLEMMVMSVKISRLKSNFEYLKEESLYESNRAVELYMGLNSDVKEELKKIEVVSQTLSRIMKKTFDLEEELLVEKTIFSVS